MITHPPNAPGWAHVWIPQTCEQLEITDAQAHALVFLGLITYSPEDGPNARVYRTSCPDRVKAALHVTVVSDG